MPESRELDPQECDRLLRGGVVGRVALSTPEGPHIIPVNYAVVDDAIVIRTTPYSLLGAHGRDAMLAFEVDHIDHDRHVGWSVVARGRGGAVLDPDQLSRIQASWQPRPWAAGARNLYLRLRWDSLTGRALGQDWTRENESAVHRTLSAL